MSKKKYPVPAETLSLQSRVGPAKLCLGFGQCRVRQDHVLSQRVIRLLLERADPAKILCLTYTRAAAANMSNRVFSSLSEWAMLGDRELGEKITEVEGHHPDAQKLRRARRLFAEALETPGGLKIQTIHAFCEAVLHQFPLEANIAAHFEMLDSKMEEILFATARREMITGAVAADNPELGEAFATVLERGGEAGLDALLKEIVGKRDGLRAFIDAVAVDAPPYAGLFEEFGFAADETAETIANSIWPLPGFPPAFFQQFAAVAEAVDARTVINNILPYAVLGFVEADPVRRLQLLGQGFLKADGDPYGPTSFKKALCDRMPDLPERYAAVADALIAASDRLALLRMIEGTRAALTIADWLIARYEQLKTGRGFLDFNDLITRTVRLLARQDAGPWVQYKLDQGIDHILLDEAQDTSPDQWNVVRRLAEEFFAGFGARDNVHRTVFAVGDEKQSIYSFQGAVPETFAETGHEFAARIRDVNASFEQVRLTLSFRSTNDVLHAVDKVFASDEARRGITHDIGPVRHDAIRFDAPGYVELWQSIGADAVEEPDDWAQAIDHARAPAVRVAEDVAATIKLWLDRGEIIEGSSGKRLTPGDVMVLVRKRDRFVHALSKSLKEKNVRVAGADRLSLPSHIAVKDLIALGRFLIQPDDDLSLAALLRSPVFALSEDGLMDLAAGRPEARSLFDALRLGGTADAELGKFVAKLDAWMGEAAFKPVFEFYSGVLGRDGVRKKMIARLGHEAGDILDEFLSFSLAEERTGLPGLEAFLATLESAGPEIKREMDQGRDEVRIMTVHAAKGLEAPVVFLIDSGAASAVDQHLPRLMPFAPKTIACDKGYLWRSGTEVSNGFSQAATDRAKERADDEYRRLLYVGMTRAEDRLVVCGYHGKRAQNPTSWHAIVCRALIGVADTEELKHPIRDETVHRFRVTKDPPLACEAEENKPPASPDHVLPAGFLDMLPPVEDLPRPLSPSGASVLIEEARLTVVSTLSPVLDAELEPVFAIERGLAVHKLLQMLPGLPEADRRAAALCYLDLAASTWTSAERQTTLEQVAAILNAPGFAPLFAPGSRAEVSVMGDMTIRGRQRSVSGKIDRLAVTETQVLIVDYKTGKPATIEEIAPSHIVQLALYRELLKPIYPGKAISAVLLFTEGPRLVEAPAAALDHALARFTQP